MSLTCRYALACAIAAGAIAACSANDQPRKGMRPILLLGTNVSSGTAVPANGVVDLAFDRYLHPQSLPSAFVVRDADGSTPTIFVSYDPASLSIRIRGAGTWLTPGHKYTLEVNGLRAIDDAEQATISPVTFTATEVSAQAAQDPPIRFCRDVQPIFKQRCSAASCHGAPAQTGPSDRFGPQGGITSPSEGLILETSEGVFATARGQVAHTSNIGATSGPAPARKFGVDMAIVDPGNPGRSWLLYKLLLAPRSPASTPPAARDRCAGGSTPPTPSFAASLAPVTDGADEHDVLSDLVRGREMPYPSYGPQPDNAPLTTDELQRIRAWILQGAIVDECGACEK